MMYNTSMSKIIYFIIGLAILIFIGYKYFGLDNNKALQQSIQNKDVNTAEEIIKVEVSKKVTAEIQNYLTSHNNYFVSKTDNICKSIQSNFDGFKNIINNPVECKALTHTFTSRIKISSGNYYCVDASGIYTISASEAGFKEGVKCK